MESTVSLNDRYWPTPAARLDVYSLAGDNPLRSLTNWGITDRHNVQEPRHIHLRRSLGAHTLWSVFRLRIAQPVDPDNRILSFTTTPDFPDYDLSGWNILFGGLFVVWSGHSRPKEVKT